MAEVFEEEEEQEVEAEQGQGLAKEEEEGEEEEYATEPDHSLEEEESEGKHSDTQDDNLATGMKKSENGTNGTEAGADNWSCNQNLGEEQCLGNGEEDEVSMEDEKEAIKTYNLIATKMVEDDEADNNSVEDDEEYCSEGGEVDNGDQEVVVEEFGVDKEVDDEEQGVDQQDYDVVDEKISVGDEVDDEEQCGDQQQDDEVGVEESPTEDENDHKTTKEKGGMNCELKEESLEENEQKSEEQHENLEEHKLQETNAFAEGRIDGAEDLKNKNKTNSFELDEAGPLEPENLILTTTLSTSSIGSTTSSLCPPQNRKRRRKVGLLLRLEYHVRGYPREGI